VVLGTLDPNYFLGGRMKLEVELANEAVGTLAEKLGMDKTELAASIVEIANENMANAIKMVSLERGHDPRRFALLAFGGAGPLHAAAVAKSLGIPKVVVPPLPGVFSAVGLLLADLRVDKVWTQSFRSTDVDASEVQARFEQITYRAVEELRQEGFAGEPEVQKAINMRYLGQNYEHEVDLPSGPVDEATLGQAFDRFAEIHRDRYGYSIEGETIELISFKVTAIGRRPRVELTDGTDSRGGNGGTREVFFRGIGSTIAQAVQRDDIPPGARLDGPLLVQEEGSTTLVAPGMTVEKSEHGSLMIEIEGES
jgi:N-methylhydantoinase A